MLIGLFESGMARWQRRIKVAIIDSNITANYICDSALIREYVSLKQRTEDNLQEGEIEIKKNNTPQNADEASHGTLVVNTMVKYSREIPMEFYIYDVFDKYGKSSGSVLVEALRQILEMEIDIVVMSLTCSMIYEEDFCQLRDTIEEKKVIMICSSSNSGKRCCPAYLDFVYGVTGGKTNVCGKYRYETGRELQFWSDVQGEFIGTPGKYSFFCGTSKATAVVAGRLACYLFENGKDALLKYLSCTHDELKDVVEECDCSDAVNKELLSKFCKVFQLSESKCIEYMDVLIPWNSDNVRTFELFMKQVGLEKEILKLNYSEFATLRQIMQSCEKRLFHT